MNRFSSCMFGLALLGLAGQAQARTPTGVRLGAEPSSAEHVEILARFSHCVAQQSPGRARHILSLDFTSRRYQRDIRQLASDSTRCLQRGTLHFSTLLFAGGMAEALMRERHMLDNLETAVAHDAARPPYAAHDETEVMSLCVVRAAPAQAAQLFRTGAASADERRAFGEITPHFTACLGAGNQLRMNLIAARALLALAAYHLATHERPETRAPAAS